MYEPWVNDRKFLPFESGCVLDVLRPKVATRRTRVDGNPRISTLWASYLDAYIYHLPRIARMRGVKRCPNPCLSEHSK